MTKRRRANYRHQRSRANYSLKERRVFRDYVEGGRQRKQPPNQFNTPLICRLPKHFSIIDNAEEILGFFADLDKRMVRRRVLFFDLSRIEIAGSDAIAMLIAKIHSTKYKCKHYEGNVPDNEAVLAKFYHCGFFNHVQTKRRLPSSIYAMAIRGGRGREVDSKVSSKIADWVIVAVLGVLPEERKNLRRSLYAMMNDCMQNTSDHARYNPEDMNQYKGREHWLYNVHYDHDSKRACVSFVDAGIGILGSLGYNEPPLLERYLKKFSSQAEVLSQILDGKIPSRTDDDQRGKGLPSMKENYKNGFISNLVIIANAAYVNCKRAEVKALANGFNGTFIYWEIDPTASDVAVSTPST